MHPLISAPKLSGILDDVVVCDLRWDLTDPHRGRETYREAHVPGAVFVDLDTDLAGAPGEQGRHPLPPIADFSSTLGRLGIGRNTHVVVYDDTGARIAARLWWMLRSIGHSEVQVLDGGIQAWIESGGAVTSGDVTSEPVSYPTPASFDGVATHESLSDQIVIDARAGERYRGEIEPIDPKAGHIPGAINIPASENLNADGRFQSAAELARLYADLTGDVAVSCGSGVTACHDALAMVVAGRPMPDVYVGSFSEWSNLDLPVNTGLTP